MCKKKVPNVWLYPPQLEKQLAYEKFVEWTCPDMMDQTEVEVKLPRFKMEEKYDLNDVLTSMGMVDTFDATMSNFSGESKSLCKTQVCLHYWFYV